MLQLSTPSNKIIEIPEKFGTHALLQRVQQGEEKRWFSQCRGLTLSSAFQPIISLNHRRIVGHEALLRTHDRHKQTISPELLFNSRENIEDTIELDRLCRALHARNYQHAKQNNEWLFLNINPDVINHGHRYSCFFSQLLDETGIHPSQVVVEVLENQASDEALLRESINYYREMGCLIAIDDFGAGHSNIDRVLHMEPEIVKLDRSLLFNTTAKAKRILSNLVALLHEAGSLVVLEGIETMEQAMLAYEIDADLVQGFFFSMPNISPTRNLPDELFPEIITALRKHQQGLSTCRHNTLTNYQNIFQQSIFNYQSGIDFSKAAKKLLNTEGVQRAYIMDEQGFLVKDNLCSKNFKNTLKPQMAPIQQANGANFCNRHYFQRAINNHGHTQITRPYLSTTDAELCITLSHCVIIEGKKEVICCDLKVPDNI